ncbi:MAG: hypothetical protein KGH63_04560 [Candidatus Micrarchaeota archaeon]|nr:hypothetical protein [Candidatus Micrarchaeota archaeon]
MRNWLYIFITLALLAAAPMAVLTNVSYGGVDTNKWTGQQIGRDTQWRPFLTPDQAATVGTDVEAGQYDYFNSTREKPQPGVAGLVVDRPHVCSGEDISFTVTLNGQPVSGADVGLYSHTNGRALVGEVMTDAYGHGTFIRQSDGGYDLHATYQDYPSGLAVFWVGPCAPGFDAYRQATTMPPAAAAPAPVRKTYASGMVRALRGVTLADGSDATVVTLSFNATSGWDNATLEDTVPTWLAGSPSAVGFQSDYPSFISDGAPVRLDWQLPAVAAGHSVERSYVLLRRFTPGMLAAFGEPAVYDARGQLLVGIQAAGTAGTGQNGSRAGRAAASSAGASANAGANASSIFPTAAALGGLGGGWGVAVGVAILLGGLGALALWKVLRKSSKAAGPAAPSK